MVPFIHKKERSPTRVTECQEPEQPFADVHTQLGATLRAYAVFRPAPPCHFPIFQIGRVLPQPDRRAYSPSPTSANLHTIFSYLQSTPQVLQCTEGVDIGSDVIQAFLHEFGRVREPLPFESLRNTTPTMTVSETSLRKAGVEVNVANALGASAGVSKEQASMWQMRLSDISSQKYAGGPLKRLIWNNAEFVFRQILLEIDTDIGVRKGDRSRIAIVTGRFLATVDISKTKEQSKKMKASAGMLEPVPITASAMADSEESAAEFFNDHRGICGMHFIMFPIEVLDTNKWRIYRGIDVCDAECKPEVQDSSTDNLFQSQRWHLRQDSDLRHCTERDYRDLEDPSAQASNSPSSEWSDSEFIVQGHITRDATDEGCRVQTSVNVTGDNEVSIDVSRKDVPLPWVDIDISDAADAFAMQQCDLADHYKALGAEGEQKHLMLLRSALRKCCLRSACRALSGIVECYARGRGVRKSQKNADMLQICLNNWRNFRDIEVSLDALTKDYSFMESLEPDLEILQLMTQELEPWLDPHNFSSAEREGEGLLSAVLVDEDTLPENADHDEEPKLPPIHKAVASRAGNDISGGDGAPYSAFISHAGPDKSDIARPLYRRLMEKGINTFLDKDELRPGGVAVPKMETAMEAADIGVFITSPDFVCREWPMKELCCFLSRRKEAASKSEKPPVVLPVFYRLNVHECRSQDLFHKEEVAQAAMRQGFYGYERQKEMPIAKVLESLKGLAKFTGIENEEGAVNDAVCTGSRIENEMKKVQLVERIVDAVLEARANRDKAFQESRESREREHRVVAQPAEKAAKFRRLK